MSLSKDEAIPIAVNGGGRYWPRLVCGGWLVDLDYAGPFFWHCGDHGTRGC